MKKPRIKIHKLFSQFLWRRPESFRTLAGMVFRNVLTVRRWRAGEVEPDAGSKHIIQEVLGFDWDGIKNGTVAPPKPVKLKTARDKRWRSAK